jgi:hypothetical protein
MPEGTAGATPLAEQTWLITGAAGRVGRCVVAVSEGICDADGTPIIASFITETDSHGNVQLSGTGVFEAPLISNPTVTNLVHHSAELGATVDQDRGSRVGHQVLVFQATAFSHQDKGVQIIGNRISHQAGVGLTVVVGGQNRIFLCLKQVSQAGLVSLRQTARDGFIAGVC